MPTLKQQVAKENRIAARRAARAAMEQNSKPWWKSLGALGSLASMAIGVAGATGALSQSDAALLTTQGPVVVTSVITGIAGVVSLFGRLNATSSIRLF